MFHKERAVKPGVSALPLGWPAIYTLRRRYQKCNNPFGRGTSEYFLPIIGYLDDVILIPLGIFLVRRFVPPTVLADCRKQAGERLISRSGLFRGDAAMMAALWLALLAALVATLLSFTAGRRDG